MALTTPRRPLNTSLAALLAAGLASAPAMANNLNTPDMGPQTNMAERMSPSRGVSSVPAGMPFAGEESAEITAEMIEASGARLVTESLDPPPLHPDLLARMEEVQQEAIVEWDSRMRFHTVDYPNRAIAMITHNGSHLCTGFMISPNTLMTSGHCLNTGGSDGNVGTWRDIRGYEVFPGRDGSSAPYGSCNAVWQSSVMGWTRHSLPPFDYGVLRLDCNVGNTVGWFGSYAPPNFALRVGASTVIGYPGDRSPRQFGSNDRIRCVLPRMVGYRDDTAPGMSGSPVWNDRGQAQYHTGAWAFAVHGWGHQPPYCGNSDARLNLGVRFTGAVINNIQTWIDRD